MKTTPRPAMRPPVTPLSALPPHRKRRVLTILAATLGSLLGCQQAHAAAERADNYEDALARAKAVGKDLVVFQRGSDWNRLSETLYQNVWMKDEFAKDLGDGFVLMAVDRPESEDGAAGARLAKLVDETAPLPPNEMTAVESEAKIPFTVRPDGTYLGAMTPNPGQDVLALKLKAKNGGRVLRLDFPMDPSLPGGGPGRVAHGNFAISEVAVQQGAAPVKLTAAWADAFDSAWGPWQAIDGISDKGENMWNAVGHARQRRTLMLVMDKPVPAGTELTVRLICRILWGQFLPGCLRAAVVGERAMVDDIAEASAAQQLRVKNSKFSWWDTTFCPRVALLDREGRAVACDNKPRLGLTPATLAARVRELRAVREKRDALWAKAEAATGPEQAELFRQSLDVMGFANWAGNENCYKPIHDRIRAADPKDESGAVRWLSFGGDPRDGLVWTEPSWAKALEKKDLTDADFTEALARVDNELKDPRNRILDHERIQRIMAGKYLVYSRWPKHEEQRFDVQREIAAFDPDTFWGIGARGELGLHFHSTTPMLTYGWGGKQVKPGSNIWDMTDTAYFFDHAGPYKLRLTTTGGKNTVTIQRVALLDGSTVLSEARPAARLGPGAPPVEVDLDLKAWRAERMLVLRVEVEAADGQTESAGAFAVEPQLLPAPAPAPQPTATDSGSRMLAGDGIHPLYQKLGGLLLAEAATGEAGIARLTDVPALRANLAQATLIRLCGEAQLESIAKQDGGAAFLQSFFKDTAWLESFLGSGKAEWPQALQNLYLLRRHGAGWEQPLNQRLATALALQWGKVSPYRLVDRFRHIQQSLRDGLMHISFESLDVREMRWAAPNYGSAKDFQFMLDDRQTLLRDYLGAHGGVRYVSFNVYGVSCQDGWNYVGPWAHVYGNGSDNRPFPAHRQVGGVCGTVSTYGSAAAQVHGIPSTAIGQPGHCAYVVRVGREWPVGNSVTWPSDASVPGWEGTNYPTMNSLYEPVNQDRERFMKAARLGWLGQLQLERAKGHVGFDSVPPAAATDWMKTYELAIAAQPGNYGTWLDYVKVLESIKDVPPKTWLTLARGAACHLAVCNEAGWAITMRCLNKVLPGMTPAERVEVLAACNRDLRQENWLKLIGFPYDGILNWQADAIGDPALAVKYLGDLLTIHYSPKPDGNWIFGSVLSWGANRFAGNPATASGHAQVMAAFFQGKGEAMDKNLLTTTVQTGIRKASEAGDIVSFRLWCDMAAKLLPALQPADVFLNPQQMADFPKSAPFPGDLLSQDGLLQTSSACATDRPLSYRQVLSGGGGGGGWFDTNPEEKPWAQVQLPGEAELTGIVLVNRYEVGPTQDEFQWAVPFKVSVSLDGKTWTEVASFDKAEAVFRIDLLDRKLQARHVRAERMPVADKTKPPGRFHFRSFQVFGKKSY
ncbi:MAG: discoidin domain-containing protein [Verrucomicrobia bacterium]|nr:discoidin domain-containing protein [Verrucomicrobiota bacterium]